DQCQRDQGDPLQRHRSCRQPYGAGRADARLAPPSGDAALEIIFSGDAEGAGGAAMSSFSLKSTLAGGMIAMALAASAMAQQKRAPPDFSSNLAGWVGMNGGGPFYEPAPGRSPAPVVSDPKHPFVPNGAGNQPSFRIADLSNPNLMPWVKEKMKADIDEILAGKKSAFTPQSSCVPAGVPFFMG